MSPRNKIFVLLDKYLALPVPVKTVEVKGSTFIRLGTKCKRSSSLRKNRARRELGVKLRQEIVAFYKSNGRWPKRTSKTKKEAILGTKFENLISKENCQFDKNLRRIVMATGRKSNNKRKHNVAGFKQEILDFLNTHGRVPSGNRKHQDIEGEAILRSKLNYYTQEKNDKTFLGKVYSVDKCHKSGIHGKYRQILNKILNEEIEKPLIRLV